MPALLSQKTRLSTDGCCQRLSLRANQCSDAEMLKKSLRRQSPAVVDHIVLRDGLGQECSAQTLCVAPDPQKGRGAPGIAGASLPCGPSTSVPCTRAFGARSSSVRQAEQRIDWSRVQEVLLLWAVGTSAERRLASNCGRSSANRRRLNEPYNRYPPGRPWWGKKK